MNKKNLTLTKRKLIILHCTTNYPARDDELNLNVIPKIRDEFEACSLIKSTG